MNDLLSIEAIEHQAIVVEYVASQLAEHIGEDLDTVLPVTVEFDVDAEMDSATEALLDEAVPEDLTAAETSGTTVVLLQDSLVADVDFPVFDDEFPMVAEADETDEDDGLSGDPRLTEMQEVLIDLRNSEVGHALRLLRQRFPHIPFPFRVRALMAVRHGAVVG